MTAEFKRDLAFYKKQRRYRSIDMECNRKIKSLTVPGVGFSFFVGYL